MLSALIAFILGTTVHGDGPFRPNDVVHKTFLKTTIERGPVETHECTAYKAVAHAPLREKQYSSVVSSPGRDKNQMYVNVDCGQKGWDVPMMANPVMTKVREWGGVYWITQDYDGFKAECTRRGANLVSRAIVDGKEYPVCSPKAPHRQLDSWK